MNAQTETRLVSVSSGTSEVAIDQPEHPAGKLALIAHPHPLFGGTNTNKVAQTLARAFLGLGYVTVRPNFRGVGQSSGEHDEGRGETTDLADLVDHFRQPFGEREVVLAGFSFGAYVQTHVAQTLAAAGRPASRLALVGVSVQRAAPAPVPADTLIIHGEKDETVPLAAVLDWARPQDLAVTVVPGADHFFHHRLTLIKRLVQAAWLGSAYAAEPGATPDV